MEVLAATYNHRVYSFVCGYTHRGQKKGETKRRNYKFYQYKGGFGRLDFLQSTSSSSTRNKSHCKSIIVDVLSHGNDRRTELLILYYSLITTT